MKGCEGCTETLKVRDLTVWVLGGATSHLSLYGKSDRFMLRFGDINLSLAPWINLFEGALSWRIHGGSVGIRKVSRSWLVMNWAAILVPRLTTVYTEVWRIESSGWSSVWRVIQHRHFRVRKEASFWITSIQQYKDVMFSAVDGMIHDFNYYGNNGVWRWQCIKVECTVKWGILNAWFAPGNAIKDVVLQSLGMPAIMIAHGSSNVRGRS